MAKISDQIKNGQVQEHKYKFNLLSLMPVLGEALLSHAKLTEHMSTTNAVFEIFLVSSLCSLVSSILAALCRE